MQTTKNFNVICRADVQRVPLASTKTSKATQAFNKLRKLFIRKNDNTVPDHLQNPLIDTDFQDKYRVWINKIDSLKSELQKKKIFEYLKYEDSPTKPIFPEVKDILDRAQEHEKVYNWLDEVIDQYYSRISNCSTLNRDDSFKTNSLRIRGGGDKPPQIQQRVVKPTSYRRTPTNPHSFKRIVGKPEERFRVRPSFLQVVEEINQYHPQMNPFGFQVGLEDETMDIINQIAAQLNKGINVNHVLDPQTLSKLSSLTDLLKGGIPVNANITTSDFDTTKLAIIVGVVACALTHYNTNSKESLYGMLGLISYGVLTQSFMTMEGISSVVPVIASYVTGFTKADDANVPQMNSGTFENILSTCTMIMITYLSGNSKVGWSKEIINQVFSYKKNFESVTACFTAVVKVFENIVSFIRRDCLGKDTFVFLETNRCDVNEFLAQVTKISDSLHHNTFAATSANATVIHELWIQSQAIIAKLPRSSDTGVVMAMNNASTYLMSVKKVFDGMNLTLNGSRVEPVSALFLGAPGVGKSNMLYPLAYTLIKNTIPKEKLDQFKNNPNTFIYNRQAECVYWDGYNMDKVVCFIDDLGQMRDVAGNPDNEWMNWIRMCSTFNYVLHMASLEKKGNVYFQSRFIIANSNLASFNVESIVEIEAFKRRVDHCYVACPKLEFTKPGTESQGIWQRRLDSTKLPIGPLGITELTPEATEFHEFNLMASAKGEFTGNILNYEQVCTQVLKTSILKEKRFDQSQLYLKSVLDLDMQMCNVPQSAFAKGVHNYITFPNKEKVNIFLSKWQSIDNRNMLLLLAHFYELTHENMRVEYILDFFFSYYGDEFAEVVHYGVDDLEEFLQGFGLQPITTVELALPYFKSRPQLKWVIDTLNGAYLTISDMIKALNKPFLMIEGKIYEFIVHSLNHYAVIFESVLVIFGSMTLIANFFGVFKKKTKGKKGKSVTENGNDSDNEPEYSGKPQRERNAKSTRKAVGGKSMKSTFHRGNQMPMSSQAAHRYDKANVDIVDKIVRRNCYELWLPDQKTKLGFVTFIRGRVFMMPKHFATDIYYTLEDYPSYIDKLATFKKPKSTIEYKCKMSDLMNIISEEKLETLDCVLVQMPKCFPIHQDITPYFYTRNNIDKKKDIAFRLVLPSVDTCDSWMGDAVKVESETIVSEVSYVLLKGFKYSALTQNGDCGGLFTIVDTQSGKQKIAGIHVAGNPSSGVGISSCITLEDIIDCIDGSGEFLSEFEDDTFSQSDKILIDGRFETRYTALHKANSGGRSKIMKSRLHNKYNFKSTQLPAKLAPFKIIDQGITKVIDPFDIAIEAYCTPFVYVKEEIIRDIGDMIYDRLNYVSTEKVDKRLLTYKEAICGIEGEADFEAISRSTSMGYPDNALPGIKLKGKAEMLGSDGEYTYDSEKCQLIVQECILIEIKASNGIRSEHIYVDCLKDERRSLEKVALGKTRLFSSCPIRLLILFRRYFGSYILWTHKNRINNGFAVGVNPFSLEWELIAQKLLQFGPSSRKNMGAGDYKGYDGKEKPVIHNDILRLINMWYSDNNNIIREILWLEITNSIHIHGDLIYAWVSGNPSGNPVTTLVNNMYNHYCAAYVYYKVHAFNLLELYGFYNHVYYITLGDDNLFSVHASKIHLFNEKAMSDHVSDLGMTYTNETKTETSAELRTLSEVAFLKRKFRYEEQYDRYCAPLELKTILEIPMWTKETSDAESITASNVDTAIRELALHDPSVFNEWVPQITKAYNDQYGKHPKTTNRRFILMDLANRVDWY